MQGTQQPVNLGLAFKCLATDVVSDYALGESYNLIETPDFSVKWFEVQRDTGELVLFAKHFPWLVPLLRHLPSTLIALLATEMGHFLTKAKVRQSILK